MRHGLKTLSTMLCLLGGLLMVRGGYMWGKAQLARTLIARAYAERVASGIPQRPWAHADTHPLGRLRIPELGYDEVVLEGANLRTMAFGPVHLEGSAAFGEPGNTVLAGHRNNWFLPLKDVRVGHTVEVEWPAGPRGSVQRARYTVTQVEVIDPLDTRYVQPTEGNALTLITCYPFTAAPVSPFRLAVRAEPEHASSAPGLGRPVNARVDPSRQRVHQVIQAASGGVQVLGI